MKIEELYPTLESYCKMFDINVDEAKKLLHEVIAYYDKGKPCSWAETLKNNWYSSLYTDRPFYQGYDSVYYFVDVLACYKVYSSEYVKMISKLDIKPKSVLDLGCGLGNTTKDLVKAFDIDVDFKCNGCGTNIEDTKQYRFCRVNTIPVAESPLAFLPKEMIFASEYFEHIEDAGDHLVEILEYHKPRYVVMANSFNAESFGHFKRFKNSRIDTKAYPVFHDVEAKRMGRLFGHIMRNEFGYKQMATGFWNNRPQVWVKD